MPAECLARVRTSASTSARSPPPRSISILADLRGRTAKTLSLSMKWIRQQSLEIGESVICDLCVFGLPSLPPEKSPKSPNHRSPCRTMIPESHDPDQEQMRRNRAGGRCVADGRIVCVGGSRRRPTTRSSTRRPTSSRFHPKTRHLCQPSSRATPTKFAVARVGCGRWSAVEGPTAGDAARPRAVGGGGGALLGGTTTA